MVGRLVEKVVRSMKPTVLGIRAQKDSFQLEIGKAFWQWANWFTRVLGGGQESTLTILHEENLSHKASCKS